MSEFLIDTKLPLAIEVIRFLLYLLIPTSAVSFFVLVNAKDSELWQKAIMALTIGCLIAFTFLATANIAESLVSNFLFLQLSGIERLQIALISGFSSFVFTILFRHREYILALFITNPPELSPQTNGGNNEQLDLERVVFSQEKNLLTILSHESKVSIRHKSVIMNIFFVVNAIFLGFYFIKSDSLTPFEFGFISVTYISLSMFMVYIFRVANTRFATLLSIQEDLHKERRVDNYIRDLRKSAEPTDNDVEILRMLLVNRAERESTTNHPYEVILKGISGSNIQLKGGKFEGSAGAAKTPVN